MATSVGLIQAPEDEYALYVAPLRLEVKMLPPSDAADPLLEDDEAAAEEVDAGAADDEEGAW